MCRVGKVIKPGPKKPGFYCRVFSGFFKWNLKKPGFFWAYSNFCQNSAKILPNFAKFCQIFAKFLPKNPYKVSEMSFFEYFNTIWNVWIIETILVLFDWNNTSTISIIFYLKKPREKPGLFEKTRAFPGFFKFSCFLPTLPWFKGIWRDWQFFFS